MFKNIILKTFRNENVSIYIYRYHLYSEFKTNPLILAFTLTYICKEI